MDYRSRDAVAASAPTGGRRCVMTVDWAALQEPEIIARLILQAFLFAASAYFSMSETALFALRDADLQKLEARKKKQAGRIRRLIEEPRQLIVSILCGNELINIAATINLAGILLILLGDPQAAAIANTAIMLPLLLLFGEITPKALAVSHPGAISSRVIEPLMTPWVWLVTPLRAVVRFISERFTTALIGEQRSEENILSEDEFGTLLRDVQRQGLVNRAERRLIQNLIAAGSVEITQIMVPRPRVAFIDADQDVPAIIEAFRNCRHRRVPVYRRRRDNIIGVLREEKVLSAVAAAPISEIAFEDLIEPANFAPSTLQVSEVAEMFKEGRHHAVIVINEWGGVEGLVSADDVFGFLIAGRRVHLEAGAALEHLEPDIIRCVGLTPLNELRRATNLAAPEHPSVATVGGLVMALLGRLPVPGDEVEEGGLVYRVLDTDQLLIGGVLIAPSHRRDELDAFAAAAPVSAA